MRQSPIMSDTNMSDTKSKVWFITGASSGFARALAEEVIARGERVVVAARRLESMLDIVARAPERSMAVRLDVTRREQIAAALAAAGHQHGRPDDRSGPRRLMRGKHGLEGLSEGLAKEIADAVAAGAPTLRLPLGPDAISGIREKLAEVAADVAANEPVALATRVAPGAQ
jgi:hypothetical protein